MSDRITESIAGCALTGEEDIVREMKAEDIRIKANCKRAVEIEIEKLKQDFQLLEFPSDLLDEKNSKYQRKP
jgi:hypothetical protein